MSDSTLNRFLGQGDDAAEAAFTPVPPTPASGPDALQLFLNTEATTKPVLKYWDGAAFEPAVIVGPASMTVLTSGTAATYTVPDGIFRLRVRVIGGGGGGGGGDGAVTPTCGAGGGGYGGAYAEKIYATTPGATFQYSVGALGAGGAAGNNAGTAGGNTTFNELATILTANGGAGGTSMAAGTTITATTAAARATAANGDLNISGSQGDRGWRFSSTIVFSGTGGDGPLGLGSGGVGGNNSVGQAAAGHGAGGGGGLNSGTGTNRAGGDGSVGVILIEEFA